MLLRMRAITRRPKDRWEIVASEEDRVERMSSMSEARARRMFSWTVGSWERVEWYERSLWERKMSWKDLSIFIDKLGLGFSFYGGRRTWAVVGETASLRGFLD